MSSFLYMPHTINKHARQHSTVGTTRTTYALRLASPAKLHNSEYTKYFSMNFAMVS